ncbi:MAG TPA: hypothetical protein PLZ95_01075 [Bryobacteraceae bacterium]|nr:hypothetical protein [Bryobacteraceae bacterium]
MLTHVKILAWLHTVLGAIGVLAGFALFSGAMAVAEIFRAGVEEAGIPPEFLQLAAFVITAVILVMSLPCLILGYGLMNLRPWARILGLVLSALNLLHFPFGTAVALYAFWVLLKPETEAMFKNTQPVT